MNLAAGLQVLAQDQSQAARFTRPGSAYDKHELASIDTKVDTVERGFLSAPVFFGDIFEENHDSFDITPRAWKPGAGARISRSSSANANEYQPR